MNFWEYIKCPSGLFDKAYLETGLVQVQHHHEFPLDVYCYGRKAVKEQVWDNVTSKCRGLIVHRETGEVIARPFEKFHNFGSAVTDVPVPDGLFSTQPVVWEKLDGFMCTLYTWGGQEYIASKGSFHSVHAKWATAEYRNKKDVKWPDGYTPVFEGLCRDLRIVVDYGIRQGLVLLGLINIETGEELDPTGLKLWANANGFETPLQEDITWERAREEAYAEHHDGLGTEEGFVLTWYRAGQTPFRLKLKYLDYLRLHRMVTGVSPKRIWEVLSGEQSVELAEWLNNSTPWFSDFVKKWHKALSLEFTRLQGEAQLRYQNIRHVLQTVQYPDLGAERKDYAMRFLTPENKEFSPILFAMLDGKKINPVVWKMVRHMTLNGHPLRDAAQ
jgi:RNA ligase